MKSLMKLVEFRVIAGLGGVACVPLLFLRGMEDPLPSLAVLFGHSGLVIYVAMFVTWMIVFKWLRTRRSADRWIFAACGAALGLTPGVTFSVANYFAAQPTPLLGMIAAGAVTGAFAGHGIWRWDDGLDASQPTTP